MGNTVKGQMELLLPKIRVACVVLPFEGHPQRRQACQWPRPSQQGQGHPHGCRNRSKYCTSDRGTPRLPAVGLQTHVLAPAACVCARVRACARARVYMVRYDRHVDLPADFPVNLPVYVPACTSHGWSYIQG